MHKYIYTKMLKYALKIKNMHKKVAKNVFIEHLIKKINLKLWNLLLILFFIFSSTFIILNL